MKFTHASRTWAQGTWDADRLSVSDKKLISSKERLVRSRIHFTLHGNQGIYKQGNHDQLRQERDRVCANEAAQASSCCAERSTGEDKDWVEARNEAEGRKGGRRKGRERGEREGVGGGGGGRGSKVQEEEGKGQRKKRERET